MEKIKLEKHKDCIIGMDHNLDFIKHSQHNDTENFINNMQDSSLFPCITWPTRVTKNSSTLIDNIFVSGKHHDRTKSCVILHDISDHFLSFIIVEGLLAKKRQPKVVLSRDITDEKIKTLNFELSVINWETVIPRINANEAYDTFIDLLQNHLDKHIPLREKLLSAKRYLCEPWLTKGLVSCGKKQLKLYEQAIKSGNKVDLLKYKDYKSVLQKTKCNCKKEYYNNKCTQFKNDTKRLWKIINNATKGQNDKSSIIDSITIENIKITESKQMASEFGKFFASIGLKTAMKGGNMTKNISHYINKIPKIQHSAFLTPCTKHEISQLISDLPGKLSSGYDNINNVLLKHLKDSIVTPLFLIFNLSLSEGIFPDAMKLADVVPLFKSGKKCHLNNYRPISLLPTISKFIGKNSLCKNL